MPPGLCQHPENNLCVADLLQGGPNQWESLQGRLDEHRRWLLQKEVNDKGPDTALAESGRSGYETKGSAQ